MKGEDYDGGKFSLPFGLLYLAESLINANYNVDIIDTKDNDSVLKEVDKLIRPSTIAIGISTMSGSQLRNSIQVAETLKKRYEDIPIIWGGVHPTCLTTQTLESDLVDYVIFGEGEKSLPLLLKFIEHGFDDRIDYPGIARKIKNRNSIGPDIGYTNLRRLFNLPYHLIYMDMYSRKLNIGCEREFYVWTSRGCPFRCRFCSNSSSIWPNTRVRLHPIQNIINDIKTLIKKYRADLIHFADQNFILNEKRLLNIFNALNYEGINLKYRFSGRVDQLLKLSHSTFILLKEAGVINISFASESGSQKVLDYMGKGITVEQIYEINDILTEHGFFKSTNFLVGTPGETKDDLKLTLKLICDLAKSSIDSPYPFSVYKYIPLPGTEMYSDAIKLGFRPPERLEDWVYFDFSDMEQSLATVRPWINIDYYNYLSKATSLVENLNYSMIGINSDISKINENINKIEEFINHY